MNDIDFENKVVIITGASSGIGAETAVAFAELKAQLILVGRNGERLTQVAEKCIEKHNQVPLCLLLDLTKDENCEIVVDKTIETYGKINVLVNCAGKILLTSLHDKSMQSFDEVMNINFRVPFLLAQLSIPYLTKTKGNIINIGSSLSKRYKPGLLPYIVTKAALAIMSKQSAPELATEGVRMNTISPGMTRTNILANLNLNDDWQKVVYDVIATELPNGKIMEPSEVARMIVVVASDMFPSLNGAELFIDGAASMT